MANTFGLGLRTFYKRENRYFRFRMGNVDSSNYARANWTLFRHIIVSMNVEHDKFIEIILFSISFKREEFNSQ